MNRGALLQRRRSRGDGAADERLQLDELALETNVLEDERPILRASDQHLLQRVTARELDRHGESGRAVLTGDAEEEAGAVLLAHAIVECLGDLEVLGAHAVGAVQNWVGVRVLRHVGKGVADAIGCVGVERQVADSTRRTIQNGGDAKLQELRHIRCVVLISDEYIFAHETRRGVRIRHRLSNIALHHVQLHRSFSRVNAKCLGGRFWRAASATLIIINEPVLARNAP